MLDAIREFFEQRVTGEAMRDDREHALRLATGALLVEVARADFHEKEDEIGVVADLLRRRFGLDAEETRALLQLAREQTDSAVSLHPFTRLINEHYSHDDKVRVIELMWQVAYADGRKDKHEEHVIRKVAELLYVPLGQFTRARHEAARESGGD